MIRQRAFSLFRSFAIFLLAILLGTMAQAQMAKPAEAPATLRGVLLSQLQSTHNKAEWFVPVNAAVAGLTAAGEVGSNKRCGQG